MRYAQIRKKDISNGPGIRVSIFVQGCHFHCKNCFNKETWDFNGGHPFETKDLNRLLEYANDKHICGLSILGGEPLNEENIDGVIKICKAFKERFKDKTIWLWSGYTYEKLNDKQKDVLKYLDVLVDGQYIDELKDYRLKYKGSSNQRVIDIKNSTDANIKTFKDI